jgi:hypothetical protein
LRTLAARPCSKTLGAVDETAKWTRTKHKFVASMTAEHGCKDTYYTELSIALGGVGSSSKGISRFAVSGHLKSEGWSDKLPKRFPRSGLLKPRRPA